MQQLIESFNQATNIEVGCNNKPDNLNRINNLVANIRFSEVDFSNEEKVTLTFSTIRKGKSPQSMSYTISRDRLSAEQFNKLIVHSQIVKS